MKFSTSRSTVAALTLASLMVFGGAASAVAVTPGSATQVSQPVKAAAATGGTKRFADVPKGHKFYTPIMWMYGTGLTTGTKTASGIAYLPSDGLSREAMAAFLYRQAGSPSFKAPARGFSDVPKSHKFYKAIMWMKAAKLSTGYADGTYRPKDGLSREAMAAFLYRQAGRPSASGVLFADVSSDHKFVREIKWMRSAGITTGYADGTYRPKDGVSREAMAAFLYRQAGSPAVVESGSLSITGAVSVGKAVTATLSGWTPARLTVSYQWYANGAPVQGATAATLQLDDSLLGKSVSVKVTAKTGSSPSVSMTSATSTVTPRSVDGTTPTIQGTVQVDRTVTANVGAWSATPTVTWLVDGKQAGTGATFSILPAHAGKKLTVRATGTQAGYATTTLTSPVKTIAYGTITGTKPAIDGPIRWSETVTANIGTWSVQPKLYWVTNLSKELANGQTLDPNDFDFVGSDGWCEELSCVMTQQGNTISLVAIAEAPGYKRLTLASQEYTIQGLDTAAAEAEILRLVNEYRVGQGLQTMVRDDRLSLGARTWVQYLNTTEKFTHSTTEWRNQYASTTWGTGENIFQACGNSVDAAKVEAFTAYKRWLGSPDHLRNITTSSWDTTGVGVDVKKQSNGMWCVTSSQIFENR